MARAESHATFNGMYLYYPVEGTQLGSREETAGDGMVYCPQRLSSIATMRCGEYQTQFGCGAACLSKARPRDIRALMHVVETPYEGRDYAKSTHGPKPACTKCRAREALGYRGRKLCWECNYRRLRSKGRG